MLIFKSFQNIDFAGVGWSQQKSVRFLSDYWAFRFRQCLRSHSSFMTDADERRFLWKGEIQMNILPRGKTYGDELILIR